MSGSAATHGDAGAAKLMGDRGPGNAQLGTDLPQGPTAGVQIGCTLNVHRDTVASLSRIGAALVRSQAPPATRERGLASPVHRAPSRRAAARTSTAQDSALTPKGPRVQTLWGFRLSPRLSR